MTPKLSRKLWKKPAQPSNSLKFYQITSQNVIQTDAHMGVCFLYRTKSELIYNILMAKTYLSGNGPDEPEPLTESQINDTRRPSSMAMSDSILRNADDDETPAIERQISHANLVSFSENVGTRNLKADPEFEAA